MPRKLNRRVLIGVAGTAVAISAGGVIQIHFGTPAMSETVSALIDAAGGYHSLRHASKIGEVFVEREGITSTTDEQARKIWTDLGQDQEQVSLSDVDLEELLSRRIAADFSQGNLIDIQGWRLSRLEVDLAVLVYLVGL